MFTTYTEMRMRAVVNERYGPPEALRLAEVPRPAVGDDQVQSALNSAYGTRQVSQIFAPEDQYQVIMQVAPQYQRDPAALSMLYVQAPAGKLVPLSAVLTTRQTVGPQSVNHIGQLPSVTMSFNLKQGLIYVKPGSEFAWRIRLERLPG